MITLGHRSTLFPNAFTYMGKCLNGGLLKTVEVYDIKVGKYTKLNEYVEIYMYQTSRSFLIFV